MQVAYAAEELWPDYQEFGIDDHFATIYEIPEYVVLAYREARSTFFAARDILQEYIDV